MKLRFAIIVTAIAVLAALVWCWIARGRSVASADRLLLLVPDNVSFADPKVTVWLDAASEEGLHVLPIHDSEFVKPLFGRSRCAGLILPDSIHQQASDYLIAAIRQTVEAGGKLLLVYDAATLSPQGRYARGGSRLSDLAGVDYAFYDRLQGDAIRWGTISANIEFVRQLNIPPGKYYPFYNADVGGGAASNPSQQTGFDVQLRRYLYGDLKYPSFVTSDAYTGDVLFRSAAGVVAGKHDYGKGTVLFVNLPLGYLKANTDGLLLHVFLKYFADHLLSLPYLMAVPDGIGGMVLNWHVDSNAAIPALRRMSSWSVMHQGPYSIHITAGPDASTFGDGHGFDAERNPMSQEFIREHVARGDAIGSHGGWIHDYFAAHADQDDPKSLEKYLTLNNDALERITRKPVVEYSAPHGNQPQWVTTWLDEHGFLAYYFTGNTGMAPTQGYRDGVREGQHLWAFPILHLDRAAAFEEMASEGYSSSEIGDWLEALADFNADHHCVRLLYFHPPGVLPYQDILAKWMEQTERLQAEGRFRWYTMTGLATFLNSRKQVKWTMASRERRVMFEASHPLTLEHETWRLPVDRFAQPVVTRGSAQVSRDNEAWLVVGGNGTELQFESRMVGP